MKTHARVLLAILFAFLSVLSYAQAPVPFVNLPLVPDATPPGGAQFTLTVNGTGFVSNSVVNWNGNALATQFVSGSQLTATVPAADIAKASTASVTVVNPAPGGGTSSVVFFSVTVSTPSVGFGLFSSPFAGNSAINYLQIGDFNGDGNLDLAVANFFINTVSIMPGDGTGNFTLTSSLGVVTGPNYLAVGDFNGDGNLDMAVGGETSGISILLGDGTGNFTVASTLAASVGPETVVVGDFNGDGNLDLAVVNRGSNTVSLFLGDGTGNFTLASSTAVGNSPAWLAAGDFNGDGKLDLAVPNFSVNTVSILLGDGTGNFTLTSSLAVGSSPNRVVVGDFNGDGKLDLAVSNRYSDSVSILLGDGTGNFTLVSSPGVGDQPVWLGVGDFNGDGKLDLATTDYLGGTVSILLGDGTGNFTLATSLAVGSGAASLAIGDFNGDGRMDLAVTTDTDKVYILLGSSGPAVSLSPTSLTFGPQLFGTSSVPQPVTLTNTGGAPLDITRIVASANFSQTNNCPHELPPSGQCTVNVVFTPRNVNTIAGTVTITDNAAGSPQTISLSGVGFAVTLLPSSLDFGNQSVGTTSQPQTVTLTNYASKAVTISGGDITGSNASSFRLQSTTCQHSLPAGASCTINIVFAPKSAGAKSATLEVNDNGGASPQTVSLSGTGT